MFIIGNILLLSINFFIHILKKNSIWKKFIILLQKDVIYSSYYDADYNYTKDTGNKKYNINNFRKRDLEELKKLALKLSEDFPNCIRVDSSKIIQIFLYLKIEHFFVLINRFTLYIFHNHIYLSELTFDSDSGLPYFSNVKYFNNSLKDWKSVDYWMNLNKKLIYLTCNLFQLFK